MTFLFLCTAAVILLLYAPYFYYILSGKGSLFEAKMQNELMTVLPQIKAGAMRNLYFLVALIVLLEAAYFFSAWSAVDNPCFKWITIGFAAFEVYHLFRTAYYFRRYIKGAITGDRVISWPLERVVVMVFIAHAIIGAILLIFP